MIIDKTGHDILASKADAIVNPVNTEGAMGKGLALDFRRKYPAMYREYKALCAAGELDIGKLYCYEIPGTRFPRYIINFPTKKGWRDDSHISYIMEGLGALTLCIFDYSIQSIAIPALGCGLGGLEWEDVKPLIEDMAIGMPDIIIYLYGFSEKFWNLYPGKKYCPN